MKPNTRTSFFDLPVDLVVHVFLPYVVNIYECFYIIQELLLRHPKLKEDILDRILRARFKDCSITDLVAIEHMYTKRITWLVPEYLSQIISGCLDNVKPSKYSASMVRMVKKAFREYSTFINGQHMFVHETLNEIHQARVVAVRYFVERHCRCHDCGAYCHIEEANTWKMRPAYISIIDRGRLCPMCYAQVIYQDYEYRKERRKEQRKRKRKRRTPQSVSPPSTPQPRPMKYLKHIIL